jgi:2-iminobutanoate/2-iminopropanoate deaminase
MRSPLHSNTHIIQTTAGGSNLENVIKITIYLTTMKNYGALNEIYQKHFPSNPPARTCIAVSGLPFDALIELDAIALTTQ